MAIEIGDTPRLITDGGAHYVGAMTDEHSAHPERVFVVHGRNQAAADSMFGFLRAIGLKPIEWDQAVAMTGKGSPYVGEVLDVAFREGQAFVILLTPDDVAYLHSDYSDGEGDPEMKPQGQARPNVLFEAGMALGRNEERTILVELGEVRPFSDVAGRHVLRLDNSAKKRLALASRLETAGCPVDRSGSHWLDVGDFNPPKPGASLPIGKRISTADKRGPSVDIQWMSRGGTKLDKVTVVNGPLDLFKVRVSIPAGVEGVRLWDDGERAKLPAYKTFTMNGHTSAMFMGGQGPEQFELDVNAELEDGTPFHQSVYVDSAR